VRGSFACRYADKKVIAEKVAKGFRKSQRDNFKSFA
jgi:hypothetical protein